MKYNLIYFDVNQLEDYFFNEDYQQAYDKILDYKTFIWTGREKNNKFRVQSITEGYLYVSKEEVNKIWVRGKNFDYEKYKDFNVINTQVVESIADDKNKTYKYLKDLMPDSGLIDLDSAVHMRDAGFNHIIKPLNELKGNGIMRIKSYTDLELYLSEKPDETFILQEFIECVDYEPLGIKGVHDIRLIIVNSEIVGLAVRQPKEGGWLCNVAQGGSIKIYDIKDIPSEVMKDILVFFTAVICRLPEDFKSAIFSIDFCNTKDGFKIFELNSYPGIRLEYKTYIQKVKELLNDRGTI